MKKIIITTLFYSFISFLLNGQSYNFDQGVKAYDEGELEKALDYFGRDIQDNPNAAISYYYRAIIYNYQNNNSPALKDVNSAIKHFTSKEKALLAGAHRLKGDIYFKIDNTEKTFEEYALALKFTPEDPEIFIDRAQIYFDIKNYQKAEEDYLAALKIDETLVQPYAGLGRNFIYQKKYSEADKILNKLIKLSPNYSSGYQFRAMSYFEQERYDEAIDDIFQAYILDETDKLIRKIFYKYSEKNYSLALSKINSQININPEKEIWYFIRAQIHERKSDDISAISDYSKLIELTAINNKSSILSYRANCYTNSGMYDQSIKDLNEAILLDSTEADYFGSRGDAKRLKGNYQEAVEDFTKAIKLEPGEAWYLYRRGWIKEEFQNNIEGGLRDYNEAISLNKGYSYAYLHRGRLYESKLKNSQKAKEDFSTILQLDTIISASGNCRQYALFHLGRLDEATAYLNEIINQYPTSDNYYDGACLFSRMNKPNESIKFLKKSFELGYRDFIHISGDDDLDNIRNLSEFKSLVSEWSNSFNDTQKSDPNAKQSESITESKTVTIPMKLSGGGTYEVPCKINDLKLNLIFDTGASSITISKTEAEFMLKNNYLSRNDVIGSSNYRIANGDIEVGTTIIFRTVDFGGLVLKNIKATVIDNKNAPLLFGQSALSKYGIITIDNNKKTISITTR